VNEADDGLVVYDPRRDLVHHLNPTAAVIFDLCDGTRDVAAIASTLAEVFGLDAPPLAETQAGVAELAEQGLIAHGPDLR
jgi:PqqD family protein of HPr-rel-A system